MFFAIGYWLLAVSNFLSADTARGQKPKAKGKLQIISLNILKILDRAVFQFITGCVVADDDAFRMHLQHADGPHLADGAFDGMSQGAGLAVAVGQDHHLAAVHDSTHTNGKGCLRHLINIILKEA